MFARTERLLLRPPFAEDAAEIAATIGDEAIVRNLASAPWPYRPEDAQRFIGGDGDGAGEYLPNWVMLQRRCSAPRIVGGIGIARRNDGTLELGYWVARSHWGLGYATEAGRQILRTARAMQLPRLTSGHFADNPASGAVLRKLGFHPTGAIQPRYSLARGQDVACVLFEEGDVVPGENDRPLMHDAADMRSEWRLQAA